MSEHKKIKQPSETTDGQMAKKIKRTGIKDQESDNIDEKGRCFI